MSAARGRRRAVIIAAGASVAVLAGTPRSSLRLTLTIEGYAVSGPKKSTLRLP